MQRKNSLYWKQICLVLPMLNKSIYEPIQLIWHITNKCNSFCKYCFTSSNFSNKTSDSKIWRTIVNKINEEKSIKRLAIIGGEPLLEKNIIAIINSLREDITINIDSNLINIKEIWNDSFKKVSFCTTLDSIENDVHNKTRSYSAEKTINNIKFLISKGVKVRAVIVISKNNIDTFEKTARCLLDLGVEKIGISRVRMTGKALNFGFNYFYDNLNDVKEKVVKSVNKLCEIYPKEKIIVYNLWYDKNLFDSGYKYDASCKCGLFKASIDWQGYMYPCELMPFYWKKFYNAYKLKRPTLKNENINDIFNNSKLFKFFRERMLYYPIGCESCDYKKACNHGCRFYAFLLSGILNSKDIACGANSVYDVIGYDYYSPFTEESKVKQKSEIGKFIKFVSRDLGNTIYDLGCGGGIWSFFLENLKKEVIGIDNDKTMIMIANEYKNLKHKKTNFILGDICNYDYLKADSAVMLDNVISVISKEHFINLLDRLKGNINTFLIEINTNSLIETKFEYKFNNFNISEEIKNNSSGFFERVFFNKDTGAKFKIKSYVWEKKELKDILSMFGKIVLEKEIGKSYFCLIQFYNN